MNAPFRGLMGLLFGAVEKIDIHCGSARDDAAMRARAMAGDGAGRVPVQVLPPVLGVEYALVHYRAGLLRPAHADVVPLG